MPLFIELFISWLLVIGGGASMLLGMMYVGDGWNQHGHGQRDWWMVLGGIIGTLSGLALLALGATWGMV